MVVSDGGEENTQISQINEKEERGPRSIAHIQTSLKGQARQHFGLEANLPSAHRRQCFDTGNGESCLKQQRKVSFLWDLHAAFNGWRA